MQTADTILDVVLIFILIAVIEYIEINPILEFIALAVAIIYGIIKIGFTISQWYYLIKNKGK
ncbi:MAG: hypothetical protein FVQ77_09915 [Cytophagales bacterium]|nr:hypothetical protein [Cytophagales bacterium]